MSRLPNFPQSGGCACGAVRYSLSEPPACIYTCHCADCQTLTTSVFSLNGVVRAEALEILSGELKTWIRTAESGNKIPSSSSWSQSPRTAPCASARWTTPAGCTPPPPSG